MIGKQIAIVGMECRYPGATGYRELWENLCAGRKAFRKMPAQRLNANYFSDHPDGIYQDHAAVIENYSFDRIKYRIPEETFLSTDISHWLALDIATGALRDAGLLDDPSIKTNTGVYIGNTLTGEMTRSNLLRQRWPFVYNTVRATLEEAGLIADEKDKFLQRLEQRYKSVFPEMQEDSLAGGLSNTIAGRICNYYDFNGGGYTVDGACSSSLLAITTACNAIQSGAVDTALAGGVDISLDPFELVGFSRTGALSRSEMKVFSKFSKGFWPGEGCGFVVLMDAALAQEKGMTIYGFINGFGISSDGKGGITRPKASMQEKAIRKAYPGQSLEKLRYVEAHGTGTVFGDQTELTALDAATKDLNTTVHLGAIKEMIGHTKAAAGIAGFIKTVLVARERMIPAQHGHQSSHDILVNSKSLEIAGQNATIPNNEFVTGVSSFGFGGINVHVSVANNPQYQQPRLPIPIPSFQDAELILFSAKDRASLVEKVKGLQQIAAQLSYSELADLSNYQFRLLDHTAPERLAITTTSGEDLASKLNAWLMVKDQVQGKRKGFSWSNQPNKSVRIGYLFPGQGTGGQVSTALYQNRFQGLENIVNTFDIPKGEIDTANTAIAQPYIVRNTAIALNILDQLNIQGNIGIGHSLGELSALYWSGSIDLETLKKLASERGSLMNTHGHPSGRMYSVSANVQEVESMINGYKVVVACENSQKQTIVSGHIDELKKFERKLAHAKVPYVPLKVGRAFHSPLMEEAVSPFQAFVKTLSIASPRQSILSPTINGIPEKSAEVQQLLVDQFSKPVKFVDAFKKADQEVDIWIEAGSGNTLSRLAANLSDKPILNTNISESFQPLLESVGYLFVNGYPVDLEKLYGGRFYRAFNMPWETTFFINPCEKRFADFEMPVFDTPEQTNAPEEKPQPVELSKLDAVRQVVAERLKFPAETIDYDSKMLDDLHMNSIVVGNIIAEVSKQFGYVLISPPTEYANASIREIADAFQVLDIKKHTNPIQNNIPQSKHQWVENFDLIWEARPIQNQDTTTQKLNPWKAQNGHIQLQLPGEGHLLSFIDCNQTQVIQRMEAFMNASQVQVPDTLIVLQDQNWAGGWIRSFFQEYPTTKVLLVNTTFQEKLDQWLANELACLEGFQEVSYLNGYRETPFLKMVDLQTQSGSIQSTDIVVVAGGAKGITAECALALAKAKGNITILLGRSSSDHEVVQQNLRRFEAIGTKTAYYSCDVTNTREIESIIQEITQQFGQPTVLLHGAGKNTPKAFTALRAADITQTLGPKLDGLNNLLDATSSWREVITFGSIIGSSGMQGNADYALANEWMSNALETWAAKTGGRQVNMAWSVWSGTGMGDSLGVLERLRAQGIEPINIETGVERFLGLVDSQKTGTVIISGRYGNIGTITPWKAPRKPARFMEQLVIDYPGKELIAQTTLSPDSDLYLDDHVIDGVRVLPTVITLEAMAQAVEYLTGSSSDQNHFAEVSLKRPIMVDEGGLSVQLVAFKKDNQIELSLAPADDPAADFIKAVYPLNQQPSIKHKLPAFNPPELEVDKEIYDALLFHTGRFRCIEAYKLLSGYEAVAAVKFDHSPWFAAGHASTLRTLHPEVNDAMLHMVQACVPHHTLLPTGMKQAFFNAAMNLEHGHWYIHAKENYRKDDLFNYNIALVNEHGVVAVAFQEVDFRIVKGGRNQVSRFNTALAEVAMNRIAKEEGFDQLEIQFNKPAPTHTHRPDGKPIMEGGFLSKSAVEGLKMTALAGSEVGCDVEYVEARDEAIWSRMLNNADFKLAQSLPESLDTACTRIWGIRESLRKIGLLQATPLKVKSSEQPGVVEFEADQYRALSWNCLFGQEAQETIFSIVQQSATKEAKIFKHSLIVGFEETNLVGNVYFANYTKWQGKVREAFLHQNAMKITNTQGQLEPITKLLSDGRLALVTCSTECKFFRELLAFDEVSMHLTLDRIQDHRVLMNFNYYRVTADGEELVAEGKQEIACMQRTSDGRTEVYHEQIPKEFYEALLPYVN